MSVHGDSFRGHLKRCCTSLRPASWLDKGSSYPLCFKGLLGHWKCLHHFWKGRGSEERRIKKVIFFKKERSSQPHTLHTFTLFFIGSVWEGSFGWTVMWSSSLAFLGKFLSQIICSIISPWAICYLRVRARLIIIKHAQMRIRWLSHLNIYSGKNLGPIPMFTLK